MALYDDLGGAPAIAAALDSFYPKVLADPKLSPTRSGITPLMAAAGLGTSEQDSTGRYKTQGEAIDAIQLLLDHGGDVNAAANDGRTALHGAALQGYDDVIKFLAAHGADLTVKDHKGFTPLDTALGRAGGFGFTGQEGVVREGTAALIRSLIDANATPSTAAHQGLTGSAVAAQH